MDSLAALDPRLAEALAVSGYPEPRINGRGAATLMRTIVGQQVSVKAAASIWLRLEATVGGFDDLHRILEVPVETLRGAGLSGQKASYIRSLAEAVVSGALDFDNLPEDDEAAIQALVAVKGIGRWSAEIYLLFAEGRTDIWPAGDLAVQIQLGRIFGLEAKPTEKATRALVEHCRPHRGALAIFMWHQYNIQVI
jgi:DNA-3-methyladenine glycosylase II